MIILLVLLLVLLIIVIILITLYFSYYEKFTMPNMCNIGKESFVSNLRTLYQQFNTHKNELQTAKNNIERNVQEHNQISNVFNWISAGIITTNDNIDSYLDTLKYDRFSRENLRIKYNTFGELYQDIINYNNTLYPTLINNYDKYPHKKAYDTAITNFLTSYNRYNIELDKYNECFPRP